MIPTSLHNETVPEMATAIQYEPYHGPPMYSMSRGATVPSSAYPQMMQMAPTYPAQGGYSGGPPPMHRMHTFTQGVATPRHRRGPSFGGFIASAPVDNYYMYNGPVYGGQAIAPHHQQQAGYIAVAPVVELNIYSPFCLYIEPKHRHHPHDRMTILPL